MNQNDKAIAVKGLTKSFKNTPVLRSVDFEVNRGSVNVCGFDVVEQF